MRENIKLYKNWYRLVKPNKAVWFFQLITCIIPIICTFCEAAFMAKVTSNLANNNFNHAIFCLTLVLILAILRYLSWDLNYRNFTRLMSEPYLRIQQKFYEKLIKAKDSNFKITSREKIINIFHSDTYDMIDFADTICTQIRYLIYIIMTLFYVGSINIFICLLVVIILVLNSIIIEKLNKLLGKSQEKRKDKIDEELEHFTKVLDSKNFVNDLNIEEKMKEDYLNSSKAYLHKLNDYNIKLSYIENYFHIFYKLTIYAISIIMIYLLKDSVVSLTIYLVVVSYITDTITNSTELFGIIKELKLISVCVNRVNLILNFEEKDELSFGTINKDDIKGEIDFHHISYKGNKEYGLGKVEDLNFNILKGEIVLFKGSKKSGKKSIFMMLRRIIKPTKGTILIDKLDIMSYSKQIHNTNVNYILETPEFFSGSIKENLKIVNKNKKEITEALKQVKLEEIIKNEYKKKMNTNIIELNKRDKYFLSIARVLLTKSEIIMFYEIPNYIKNEDKELLKELILTIKQKNTILIFDEDNDFENIITKEYIIKDGKITKENNNE